MTDKITLELTIDELKILDKHIEYNEETKSVFDKIKYAYPQLKMTLQQEGDYAVVSYNDTTYYRFMNETTFAWYIKKGVSANYHTPTLVMVIDGETERLLEGLYYNHIEVKKEKVSEWEPTPQTPEQVADGLKEAFVKVQQTEKWKEIQKKIDDGDFDDFIERTNLLDFLKDKLGYSLDCCYEIVDAISEWLPETQSADGSQNVYVECTVEGWNDCINAIRGKLQ